MIEKWIGRYALAGIALVIWAITYWGTGELPPTFMTVLTSTAWGWVFTSREKEKTAARKKI